MTISANSQKGRLSLARSEATAATPARAKGAVPLRGNTLLKSNDLFGGTRQVQILHEDSIYRLTITRQGKLILTK